MELNNQFFQSIRYIIKISFLILFHRLVWTSCALFLRLPGSWSEWRGSSQRHSQQQQNSYLHTALACGRGKKTAMNGNMHTVVQTRCLTSVNDAGDNGISAVRTRSASRNLKFKVKLTTSKIPNPAVAFWVNHSPSLCPSLSATLHLCSFILCWRAGGGQEWLAEGVGVGVVTVAFLPEQLPRSSWIRGSFIFYLQEMWRKRKQRFWQYRV